MVDPNRDGGVDYRRLSEIILSGSAVLAAIILGTSACDSGQHSSNSQPSRQINHHQVYRPYSQPESLPLPRHALLSITFD